MIIIGAQGFAKQLIDVLLENNHTTTGLNFFDDVTAHLPPSLYGIPIITDKRLVEEKFKSGNNLFCLGIGGPDNRMRLANLFIQLGGELTSVISCNALLAKYIKNIGKGATILSQVIIENDVEIGNGVLVNSFAGIYHESVVGNYCEIAPGAKILGKVIIEDNCFIGANATILPGLKIGFGSIIGAGAVVTKDLPPYSKVIGIPANKI